MKSSGARRLVWFFILVTALLHSEVRASAPDTVRNIPAQRWKELTSDKIFSYKDKLELARVRKPVPEHAVSRITRRVLSFFATPTGKVLIWGCFLLLVGYTVYKAFTGRDKGLFKGRTKKEGQEAEENEPRDIMTEDWEALLKEAIQAKDPRQAVRYCYLHLLQLLHSNSLIEYRPAKTNLDYRKELGGSALSAPFLAVTRQYEYAWYGKYPVPANKYDDYLTTYEALRNKLQRP